MTHTSPHGDRHGARQKQRFDPQRAARLDDPARFGYLPVRSVAGLLRLPTRGRLIDFGTGTGTYAIELARRRPDVEIFALDELPAMLRLMRAKLKAAPLANLHPMAASQARRGAPADRVLALNVLHELGDAALRSLRRLLKPRGMAVFIDWNAAAKRPVGPPADHVYNPAEARRRLVRLGFEVGPERLFSYHYAFRARRASAGR